MSKKAALALVVPAWLDEIDETALDAAVVAALVRKRSNLRHGAPPHHQGIVAGDALLEAIAHGLRGDIACQQAALAEAHYDRVWTEDAVTDPGVPPSPGPGVGRAEERVT